MAYESALAHQESVQQKVIESRTSGIPSPLHLLLVEHDPPVITISRRASAREHLLATEQQLKSSGVQVCGTNRGGDITYHGLGQLVGYPIFDLNVLSLRLHGYMRFLEGIMIDVLDHFGIDGHRDSCATGVWVENKKICALGVRITRWVSMHGFALNVKPNMDHFNFIVPCGLTGRSVTSMHQLLGDECPSMDTVKRIVSEQFKQAITKQKRSG